MKTSLACLAKADEMDALSLQCSSQSDPDAYLQTAAEWRRVAALARRQDALRAGQARLDNDLPDNLV